MQVTIHSPVGFETYDYRNPDHPGIGGSETAVREYAWRLARRGHEVTVYAPIPDDCVSPWRGSEWKRHPDADFSRPGTWILSRCPTELDHFPLDHPGQKLWVVSQDTDYPGQWTEERLEKVDRIIGLCESHCTALQNTYEKAASKVCLGFNGLRCDLIQEIESQPIPPRNPRRIIFASSPDRGLLALLKIFRRCRDWGSGSDGLGPMELWIGYGFDNIEKWINSGSAPYHLRVMAEEIAKEAQQEGVTFLGRLGQPELNRRRLECGLACHPTMFTETGMISVIEEMAMGCIPVLAPIWAAGEYGRHGVWIQGDPNDPLIMYRYVAEICNLARQPEIQTKIRTGMMAWARARFNWEWMIDLMESWMERDAAV